MPGIAHAAVLTACIFWAVSFIATKIALTSAPPLTIAALRVGIAALCFVVWGIIKRNDLGFSQLRRGVPRILEFIALSLFAITLHYGMQTYGMQFTTAANASIYAVTGPVTILIIAALFLGERITWRKAIGLVLAIFGVLTVMGLETLLAFELHRNLLGDLLVLGSIFMWGVFTVWGKKTVHDIPAIPFTALITILGLLTMVPLAAMELNSSDSGLADISITSWLAIAFLGVTCSFLANLLYVSALRLGESQKVGIYLYTIPPMTTLLAVFTIKETVGINLLLGSVLVILGVLITERG